MRQALASLPLRALALLSLLSLLPGAARADGVREPERWTAGVSDQLLGQLSADGERLYYASTERATSQIFVQERRTGAGQPLFEETADATWPRLSPDGKRLLYISYQNDAGGDLCVRALDRVAERRCLEDPAFADLQATWMPDGRSVLLLSRKDLHGEFLLRRVWLDGGAPRAEPFLGGLASPAVSPDGRWLAYIPVARKQGDVGPSFAFLSKAASELLVQRIGPQGAEGEPRRLRFDLPGFSGQPAFSADGRFLYFTQYLNDTSLDGSVDGRDHGVLFRVPFDGGAAAPVPAGALAAPTQLSSAGWNCQYPSPTPGGKGGPGRLIVTCAFEGSLDVYSLPLDGAVPAEWSEPKLRDELRSSQDRWEQLLLQVHLLATVPAAAQAPLLFSMTRMHLGLREYQSASFYARQIQALGGAQATMGAALGALIDHRREERSLDRGQLSAGFVEGAGRRLGQLGQLAAGAPPAARALCALVQSEILDTLGRKGEALAALRGVVPAEQSEAVVLHLYAERAREQLRPLNDGAALLAAYRALATHEALPPVDRLGYGAAFVHELGRGQGAAAMRARLDAQRAQVDPASDLGFLLELEGWLQQLRPDNQEPVRAGVFALYQKNDKDPDRRRALIAATVGRAAAQDSDFVTYQFANTWVSGLPRASAEWRYAFRLYEQVVLARAYVEWSRQSISDARGRFYGVTRFSSLEAHVGYIETAAREGKRDVAADYTTAFKGKTDEPEYRFVLAYLLARALPAEGPALDKALDDALRELQAAQARPSARTSPALLSQHVEFQHLWGFLAHRRYLATGRSESAQEASSHYLLALDLARDNPRYRAAILGQLGLLQEAVGNHRAALGYLEDRSKLPFVDPQAELRHLLALARTRFHADRAKEGAAAAEEALALLGRHPDLVRYRALVLDRAALYHLSAGDYGAALACYRELTPLLEKAPASDRLAHRLGRAAAALGAGQGRDALADLDVADRLLADRAVAETLRRPQEDLIETLSGRRLIILGLRAQAHRALGQVPEAERALTERLAELDRRLKRRDLDEDVLKLARIEAALAGLACQRRDLGAALRHVQAGLVHTDSYGARTGTPVHETGLGLLEAYAELHLFGKAPAPAADLTTRLADTHRALGRLRSPRWAELRGRLGTYRTLVALGSASGTAHLRDRVGPAMLLRALVTAGPSRSLTSGVNEHED